jgi:arylsulfatase A-like enzyme
MTRCLRFAFLFASVFFFPPTAAVGNPVPDSARRLSQQLPCNVLLLTVDSCRVDRLGCYGYGKNTTPAIDTWASTGTVFENAYSTASWTVPGLVSLLSGLYPPTHGVNNRDHTGSASLATLLKIFKNHGYEVPNLNFFTFAPYYANLGLPPIQREYFGPNYGDELLNWLERRSSGSEAAPFFVWYHNTMIHQPYNPDPADLSKPVAELQKSPGIRAAMTGAIVPKGSAEFAAADKPVLDELYDAELRRVDRLFAAVLARLREKRLLENTLVILTADHGEELLDHGFIGHASTSLEAKLYEELVRIPLIISWPGRVPAAKRTRARVSLTDVFPTVLRLCELAPPVSYQQLRGEELRGRDLFSPLTGRNIYLESVIAGNQTTKERENIWVLGILEGDYKYISTGELYNLKRDPREKSNLIREKPALAARLKRDLEEWRKACSSNSAPDADAHPKAVSESGGGGPDCPRIFTPEHEKTLDYDVHTGMLLFDWAGSMNVTYLVEYDIGVGDHHVAGVYEAQGNHQLLGPFTRELWGNLKAWNPFKIRVTPKSDRPCWSGWTVFYF